uniref:Protein kinase domain-containing protein n=1 Tax=Oryza meridionalis TaxID=40149 RepID=A0A0E0FAV6_9ORYZ
MFAVIRARRSSLPVGIPKLPRVRQRELMNFSFIELEAATHNFATTIGQGGSGTVYKGVLSDGVQVAIKKHTDGFPSQYGEMPKKHPLILLRSMLEHKNIVKLVGYCHEYREIEMPKENATNGNVSAKEEFLLLVEEYMTNGNLGNLIYGITQGVVYLHTHSEKPIVHLDLKPDNILLDSSMNPKIGDFGLSKELQDDDINASVSGTLGYMPPEYIIEGTVSLKNDVYGFGVTLLETITRMSESGRGARHQASIEWAWNVRLSRGMNKLFDPRLCDESQLKEIKRCMDIGLLCTQNKATERPTMQDVLKMIQGKKKVPTPKQPGYIKRARAAGPLLEADSIISGRINGGHWSADTSCPYSNSCSSPNGSGTTWWFPYCSSTGYHAGRFSGCWNCRQCTSGQ